MVIAPNKAPNILFLKTIQSTVNIGIHTKYTNMYKSDSRVIAPINAHTEKREVVTARHGPAAAPRYTNITFSSL